MDILGSCTVLPRETPIFCTNILTKYCLKKNKKKPREFMVFTSKFLIPTFSDKYKVIFGTTYFWITEKYFACLLKRGRICKPSFVCKDYLVFRTLWCKHGVIQLFINSLCGFLPLSTQKCSHRFCQSESEHKQCSIHTNTVPDDNSKDERETRHW